MTCVLCFRSRRTRDLIALVFSLSGVRSTPSLTSMTLPAPDDSTLHRPDDDESMAAARETVCPPQDGTGGAPHDHWQRKIGQHHPDAHRENAIPL
mmetsp:Transcript_52881/g.132928  ORF Transcript_52881/g.132928 Transcript_52881/m.132928 type:complete len:95 (+) Transcript_52881:683-967(+)